MRGLFPIHELMLEAIREAEASVAEDARPHPKVGAILADSRGHVIARAHRGERGRGDHAEHILLQKVEEIGLEVEEAVLVVTLEPCTKRGKDKVPCAERVVRGGIGHVWIGALDPNPVMRGCGESVLRYAGIRVERFPAYLVESIHRQSAEFIATFADIYRRQAI